MDPRHIGVGPRENVLVLLEHLIDVLGFTEFQKGTNIGETIILLRDLDGLQRIYHRGIFIRQIL